MGYWRSRGARRVTVTETMVQVAGGIRPPVRMEPGETAIRKRYRRDDETERSCFCASRICRTRVYGNRCHFRDVEAEEKPNQKSKKGGAKGSVALF